MNNDNLYASTERFLRSLSLSKLFLLCFAIALLWHYLLYGATLWFDFGKDDDYYFFSYDTSNFEAHPQFYWWQYLGRYGSGFIWEYLSPLITDISDLFWIRVISLLMSSISMSLLVLSFARIKSNILFALFISALIFSLPAIALNFTYVLGAPSTMAWIFSLLAFLGSFVLFGNQLAPSKFGGREVLGVILAFSLLWVSIIIYQMSMFFFLIPCTFAMIFGDRKIDSARQTFFQKIWIAGFPMIITASVALSYFVFHKLIYLPKIFTEDVFSDGWSQDQRYSFNVSSSLMENIKYYFDTTIPRIFDLINLHGYTNLWLLTVIIILLAIIATLYKCFGWRLISGKMSQGLIKYGSFIDESGKSVSRKPIDIFIITSAVCGYYFLSSAPIIYQGTHSTYRVILVMSAIVFIVLVWATLRILPLIKIDSRIMKVFLSFSSLISVMISTNITVFGTSLLEYSDVRYVRGEVRSYLNKGEPLDWIHLISPSGTYDFNGKKCGEEFLCSSSRNPSHFVWAIKAVVEEETNHLVNFSWSPFVGERPSEYTDKPRTGMLTQAPLKNYNSPVVMTASSPNAVLPNESGMLVIDLNNASFDQSPLKVHQYARIEEPKEKRYGRHKAFDGWISLDKYWEEVNFPIELIVDFEDPKTINSYSFYSVESPERMPQTWKLEAFYLPNHSIAIPEYVESKNVIIVSFNGHIYSIPQSLGIEEREILENPELLNLPNIFTYAQEKMNDDDYLTSKLIDDSQSVKLNSSKIIILANERVNIVKFAGRIYSVPQALGEILLEQWRKNEVVASLPGVFHKPLLGEPDSGRWVEIDKRKLERQWGKFEKQTFSVRVKGEYKKLKWTFKEGFDPNVLRLYEITVD
jgi:hypothetical protein